MAAMGGEAGVDVWNRDGTLGEMRVVRLAGDGAALLQLGHMEIDVQVHLAVAIVKVDASWVLEKDASAADAAGFVLEVPKSHTTTISSATVQVENGNTFEAMVVDGTANIPVATPVSNLANAAEEYAKESGVDATVFNPELFSLPFHGAQPGEQINVEIKMLVNLQYESGYYALSLPLNFSPASLGGSKPIDLLDITLSSTKPERSSGSFKSWKSDSFAFEEVSASADQEGQEDERLFLRLSKVPSSSTAKPFKWSYLAASSEIQCRAYLNPSPERQLKGKSVVDVEGGVFSTILLPPLPNVKSEAHPRDVVFLLDRSGSMGHPHVIGGAKDALIVALDNLAPHDRFAICAFDHAQLWFGGSPPTPSSSQVEQLIVEMGLPPSSNPVSNILGSVPPSKVTMADPSNYASESAPYPQDTMARTPPLCVDATPENIARAKQFVFEIQARGLTDILSPMTQAFWGLFGDAALDEDSSSRVKTVFLITDGAVQDEREICQFADQISSVMRIFCFGIGSYCNAYFLRKLASIGRGYADVSYLTTNVHEQMTDLLLKAKSPILTELSIMLVEEKNSTSTVGAMRNMRWVPEKVQDLYALTPVIVACSYEGVFPSNVALQVQGKLEDGSVWSQIVQLTYSPSMPLRRVFAQQSVDHLVAASWLEGPETKKGAAIQKECVAVAVAESIPCPYTAVVAVERSPQEIAQDDAKYADDEERRMRMKVKKRNDYILLGASLLGLAAFGSVIATMDNTPSTMDMGADAMVGGDIGEDGEDRGMGDEGEVGGGVEEDVGGGGEDVGGGGEDLGGGGEGDDECCACLDEGEDCDCDDCDGGDCGGGDGGGY